MYKKNPIYSNLDINQTIIEKTKKTRNYLDSSNMKSNLEHPHPDNATFSVRRNDNTNQFKHIYEQSNAINSGNKNYLRNGTHIFGGKTGFYM